MASWSRVDFGHDTVVHCVPAELVSVVVNDLTARGGSLVSITDADKFYLDGGGMCLTGRPIVTVDVDGLELSTAAEDVMFLLYQIQTANLRRPGYYKVHGMPHRALVLTPEQRDALTSQLKEILPEAEVAAEAHFKAWEQWMKEKNHGRS